MSRPEQIIQRISVPEMAKPGIPVKEPQRRQIPDILDPMPPRVVPKPIEPIRKPSEEPVPVGSNS